MVENRPNAPCLDDNSSRNSTRFELTHGTKLSKNHLTCYSTDSVNRLTICDLPSLPRYAGNFTQETRQEDRVSTLTIDETDQR